MNFLCSKDDCKLDKNKEPTHRVHGKRVLPYNPMQLFKSILISQFFFFIFTFGSFLEFAHTFSYTFH